MGNAIDVGHGRVASSCKSMRTAKGYTDSIEVVIAREIRDHFVLNIVRTALKAYSDCLRHWQSCCPFKTRIVVGAPMVSNQRVLFI